jgi:hypothetical protein
MVVTPHFSGPPAVRPWASVGAGPCR